MGLDYAMGYIRRRREGKFCVDLGVVVEAEDVLTQRTVVAVCNVDLASVCSAASVCDLTRHGW